MSRQITHAMLFIHCLCLVVTWVGTYVAKGHTTLPLEVSNKQLFRLGSTSININARLHE